MTARLVWNGTFPSFVLCRFPTLTHVYFMQCRLKWQFQSGVDSWYTASLDFPLAILASNWSQLNHQAYIIEGTMVKISLGTCLIQWVLFSLCRGESSIPKLVYSFRPKRQSAVGSRQSAQWANAETLPFLKLKTPKEDKKTTQDYCFKDSRVLCWRNSRVWRIVISIRIVAWNMMCVLSQILPMFKVTEKCNLSFAKDN